MNYATTNFSFSTSSEPVTPSPTVTMEEPVTETTPSPVTEAPQVVPEVPEVPEVPMDSSPPAVVTELPSVGETTELPPPALSVEEPALEEDGGQDQERVSFSAISDQD